MRLVTGQAPNLPWYKIATMSDKEIETYNMGFMRIIEMTDDNLSDVQQLIQSKGYRDALKEGMEAVEKANSVGISKAEHDESQRSVFEREIWNKAIEAAAEVTELSCYYNSCADEIRKLKK